MLFGRYGTYACEDDGQWLISVTQLTLGATTEQAMDNAKVTGITNAIRRKFAGWRFKVHEAIRNAMLVSYSFNDGTTQGKRGPWFNDGTNLTAQLESGSWRVSPPLHSMHACSMAVMAARLHDRVA